MLMATSFGHNGYHQDIEQKLKQAGTYSAKSSIYMTILRYTYVPACLSFCLMVWW